jgi:hypothetical protein
MTLPWEPVLRAFHRGLLRGASLLVPGKQRAEWSQEWQSELWYVCRECTPAGGISWSGEREATAFCLGAYQDASYLRRHAWQERPPLAAWRGSPAQCILLLFAVLAASYGAALLLPGVRTERHLSGYSAYAGLVLIQDARDQSHGSPTISPQQFRAWTGSRQRFFDRFAFYRVTQETVSPSLAGQSSWGVARASSNLFALLDLPLRCTAPAGGVDGNLPRVVLSDAVWKSQFNGNPNVAGRVVNVGSRKAKIAGVAPEGSWRLPGKVDAWLLEPKSEMASDGMGYVVAHLTSSGKSEMWAPRVQITAYKPDDSEDDLLGVSLDEGMPPPWAVFLFAVLLAFLAVPATTSVSMGDYSVNSQKLPRSRRFCRWGFLSAKIGLLLPIAYFASLDLAYSCMTVYSPSSMYIHWASSFSICLFGLRWALQDQQQRCPVCLRLVVHPARVGLASRTFLGWNGTELMCLGGHTLLHIPGLPTSWFSTQRWLYLDPSWGFLFPGSSAGTKEEMATGFSPH